MPEPTSNNTPSADVSPIRNHDTQLLSRADLVVPDTIDRSKSIVATVERSGIEIMTDSGLGSKILGAIRARAGERNPHLPTSGTFERSCDLAVVNGTDFQILTISAFTVSYTKTAGGRSQLLLIRATDSEKKSIDLPTIGTTPAKPTNASPSKPGATESTPNSSRETGAVASGKFETLSGPERTKTPPARTAEATQIELHKAESLKRSHRAMLKKHPASAETEAAVYRLLQAEAKQQGKGAVATDHAAKPGQEKQEKKAPWAIAILKRIDAIKAEPEFAARPIACALLAHIVDTQSPEKHDLKTSVARFCEATIACSNEFFSYFYADINDLKLARAFFAGTEYAMQIPKK